MQATFGKWFRKVREAFEGPKMVSVGFGDPETINKNTLRANQLHAMEVQYMTARPVVDWVDPVEANYFDEGIGSITTLHHTAGDPIAETKSELHDWVHQYDDLTHYTNFQRMIDAAFAKPLMTAIMWALDGEMAGVTGKAQVESASWMEHTGEIDVAALQDLLVSA